MARGRKRKVSSVDSSSPSANAVVVSLAEITEAVSGRKTTESTKVNYRGKINMIKAWCHTAYPALIISDDSDNKTKKEFRSLPLPVDVVIEFFTTRTVPAYKIKWSAGYHRSYQNRTIRIQHIRRLSKRVS